MFSSLIPSILQPDFTWPRPWPSSILETTPPSPHIPSRKARIAWGIAHKSLYYLSKWYCFWFGVTFDANIVQLPFGLVMKWTDRTSIEEVASMQMAAAAGIPVPRVLNCGEHPKASYNRRVSILMTRLPGVSLENSNDELQPTFYLSLIGTSLRNTRVPDHIMGPFTDHMQLFEHLISPASPHGFTTLTEFEYTLARAKKSSNAIIGLFDEKGHLSGFLDWESAGCWWYQVASWLGGDQYLNELDSDIALNLLTVDSYVAI
ncbi:hypothetical protein BDV11DRAFT_209463 [Aspergillus similis]